MKINFAMWRTAMWTLVKMEKKEEWDALDVISKWLIATRSGVTTVTIYSCIISGLLAWRYFSENNTPFPWIPWLIITLGLFIAHGTNNLLNDYTDYSRGIDTDNYFRTQYGVHPLVQQFWDKKTQLKWFYISGTIAFITGLYALWYTQMNMTILLLFIIGILALLFYTYPLKHFALGEISIFLIWGPILIGGVYCVLTGQWDWLVALAGVPFGLTVVSINLGKHIDKLDEDKKKRVKTLPVAIGEKAARYVNIGVIVIAYSVILYLIFVPRFFTPIMLITFFAIKRAILVIGVLTKPRPVEPPKEWLFWPTWFSGFAFYHNRMYGGLLILGILLDSLIRIMAPTAVNHYWSAFLLGFV
jgi:1,4-dihydroxy-2-naphthoate polyprenyltransferase